MFEPGQALVDLLVETLESEFDLTYGSEEHRFSDTVGAVARTVLPKIAASDALYHNVHHTLLVTLLGLDILSGKRAMGDAPAADQWANFIVSLLCHDAGFAPGVCAADSEGAYASGNLEKPQETVVLPPDSTDAALAPHHVDRSILFVHEQYSEQPLLDVDQIAANIERTRFPVPEDELAQRTDDLPGLARAADLLAQGAEQHPRRRYPALFYEFEETGLNQRLGYSSPRDLRLDFPRFFEKVVSRYCNEGMRLLEATDRGRERLANLERQLTDARAAAKPTPG